MIQINLDKAKDIAHQVRRKSREELFKPLDILVTIPAQAEEAEAKRQAIRDANAETQVEIEEATTVTQLLKIVEKIK